MLVCLQLQWVASKLGHSCLASKLGIAVLTVSCLFARLASPCLKVRPSLFNKHVQTPDRSSNLCTHALSLTMTSRNVTIVGMSGHLLDLEMPCEDISCWDVMREVKRQTNIPGREQKFMWGETMLTPRSIIPSGDDIVLHLVRTKPVCGNCGKRQRRRRRLLLCSGCLNVAYCGSACQRSDWRGHRALCCKCEN